jgi:aminoacyl tRNA synthase complex-interacting multifunctional protein 1
MSRLSAIRITNDSTSAISCVVRRAHTDPIWISKSFRVVSNPLRRDSNRLSPIETSRHFRSLSIVSNTVQDWTGKSVVGRRHLFVQDSPYRDQQRLGLLKRLLFTQGAVSKMEDLTTRAEEVSIKDSSNAVKSTLPAPSEEIATSEPPQNQGKDQAQQKKEKKAKAPKTPVTSAALPLSPALIDLRVGHILRCIPHENADSLYVSTIAMGDPEGTDNTRKDTETGRIVRTVCSGLRGLIPLEQMQDRKVIVLANLKPVTMRGIKSAAMVLAASPVPKEGDDAHAADRVVELVSPPETCEGGDRAYFDGWEYGQGKGPEKVLNPKKKQWEAVQPGLYTDDEFTVVFDAARVTGVEGGKGELVIEGKEGKCKVQSLKAARLS